MFYVLTYCSNYNYQIYQRFVGSLVDTSHNVAIIFFIKTNDIHILKKIQNEFSNISIRYVICDDIPNNIHIQTYRFQLYCQYLKTQILNTDDYILLCDSRDLLFQKDVMEIEKFNNEKNDIFIFEEDDIIKNNKHNSKWINKLNSDIAEDISYIKEKQIICSGTILGTFYGISCYLEKFNKIVDNLSNKCREFPGLDQGIHNYIIYSGKLGMFKVKTLNNIDNYINTICLGRKGLNDDNKIVNINNEVSCIVHQYDRLSDNMKSKLSTKYDFVMKR
jgi:hypothetical protein